MGLSSFILNKSIDIFQRMDKSDDSPIKIQEITLQKLLKKASETAFGKAYDFSKITSSGALISEFQKRIPIHDYDKMFDEWWHQSLQGKSDVTWKGTVKYFALSSGTSGAASKYIPITRDMQQAMRKSAFDVFSSIRKFNISNENIMKSWLTIGGSASLEKYNKSFVGDLSGINSLKPPFWLKNFRKPSLEIAKLKTWEERTKSIISNAPFWDVSILVGIPSWVQLTLERVIEYHDLDNIHDIWPNLSMFVTGGICFDPYRQSFEKLLAKPISYLDTYLASEGFIAYQNCPSDDSMKLQLNSGIFYEFVPFNETNFDEEGKIRNNAKALTINEIEEGVNYALLISSCAGAWRYLLGDHIRFLDKKTCKICITGRTKHFLSVCGEHLSIDNMNQAISNLNSRFKLDLGEFTVGAIPIDGHFRHQWFIGSVDLKKEGLVAKLLDEELKKLNDDYRAERSAMLRPPSVKMINPTWFYDWKKIKGKMNGQSKVSRVMKGANFENWRNFIAKKSEGQSVFLLLE